MLALLYVPACNPHRDSLPPAHCRTFHDCAAGEACEAGLCRRPGRLTGEVRGATRWAGAEITVATYRAAEAWGAKEEPAADPLALAVLPPTSAGHPYVLQDLPLGSIVVVAVAHLPTPHARHAWPCKGERYGTARVWLGPTVGARALTADVALARDGTDECP